VAEKRARWHEPLASEAAVHFVFVDESGANTKMTRLRGHASRWDATRPARGSPACAWTAPVLLGFLQVR
jgi:hypothetical protein